VWIVNPKTQAVSQRLIRVAGHDAERVVVAEGLDAGDAACGVQPS
jgi:multidrug efflux pump subunit AcrA (membrane-fusion protein)